MIGDTIRRRREQLGLTQGELGKKIGESQQSISNLESGKTSRPLWLDDCLAVLKLTYEEAVSGKFPDNHPFDNTGNDKYPFPRGPANNEVHNVREGPTIKGNVPLISLVQAGEAGFAVDNLEPGDAEDWLVCPVSHSNATYALTVSGDSMTSPHGKSYPDGINIFVDPEQRGGAVAGDLVVAKINGRNAVTFKQLGVDEGRPFLRPLNPKYDPIFDEFRVLGLVIYAGFKP